MTQTAKVRGRSLPLPTPPWHPINRAHLLGERPEKTVPGEILPLTYRLSVLPSPQEQKQLPLPTQLATWKPSRKKPRPQLSRSMGPLPPQRKKLRRPHLPLKTESFPRSTLGTQLAATQELGPMAMKLPIFLKKRTFAVPLPQKVLLSNLAMVSLPLPPQARPARLRGPSSTNFRPASI